MELCCLKQNAAHEHENPVFLIKRLTVFRCQQCCVTLFLFLSHIYIYRWLQQYWSARACENKTSSVNIVRSKDVKSWRKNECWQKRNEKKRNWKTSRHKVWSWFVEGHANHCCRHHHRHRHTTIHMSKLKNRNSPIGAATISSCKALNGKNEALPWTVAKSINNEMQRR